MLHILLLILKIIGIIIAVILGILILLLCIIIFVPVRYEGKAESDGSLAGIRGYVKVSWLLHLMKATVVYEEQNLNWRIRIAWKTMRGEEAAEKEGGTYDEDELDRLLKEYEEESEESASAEMDQTEQEGSKKPEGNEKETGQEPGLHEGTEEKFQKVTEAVEEAETDALPETPGIGEDAEGGTEEHKGLWQKIRRFCQKIVRVITGICRKITYTFRQICDRIELLGKKKDKIVEFLTDEVHRSALFLAKDELFKLLYRLRPKKLRGRIHYGFEDPYHTGQVLAAAGVLYPFYGERVSVEPDFEQRVLEGDLYLKGRIRVLHFVRLLWKLVFNKNVRDTYRHIREFEL